MLVTLKTREFLKKNLPVVFALIKPLISIIINTMRKSNQPESSIFARSYTICLTRAEVPIAISALGTAELMPERLIKELVQIVDLQFFDRTPESKISLKITLRNNHTLVYVSKDTMILDIRDIDEVDNWKLVFTRAE